MGSAFSSPEDHNMDASVKKHSEASNLATSGNQGGSEVPTDGEQQNASEVQSGDAGADAGGEALPQESAPETIDDAQGITNCKCGKFNVVISRLDTDGDVDDE